MGDRIIAPPVRVCCGERHYGVMCPDGKVMCCQCFNRFDKSELSVDPEDGVLWDVCKTCDAHEKEMLRRLP